MSGTVGDLKPDRSLIDPNFDGYKLSLEHLPGYKKSLTCGPEVLGMRDDQYTYQHVKAYGVHNCLSADPWNPEFFFFVDSNWDVLKHDMNKGPPLETPLSVFQIPEAAEHRQNMYRLNVTLHCTAREWLVLGDGAGNLYLVHTGDRKGEDTWKVCYKGTPVAAPEPADKPSVEPFIVLHSVRHAADDGARVECLLLHVEKNPDADNENRAPPFLTKLTWVTLLSVDDDKWELERTRQLSGLSSPDYAALDANGSGAVLASQKPFQFVSDSQKSIEKPTIVNGTTNGDSTSGSGQPNYVWTQTAEDVTLFFSLPPEVTKPDILYKLTSNEITLGVKNSDDLLEGALHGKVDVEASTWTISQQDDQNRLELHLEKQTPGTWTEVVDGSQQGHLVTDIDQLEEIHERLSRITSDQCDPDPDKPEKPYNAQQLEDCDEFPEESAILVHYDGDSHEVTHQANLSSHQWLFNVQAGSDGPPCLCLRHDVDGLVWQPTADADSPEVWRHLATFNAFGYVQASKQQKKYMGCSPDFSYAAICDGARHIYIYRQPAAIASPLRNRKTGREVAALAKQQLVSLDSVESIVGMHVANNKLHVMVGKTLHMIQVNAEAVSL